nr:unnamed protein product [Callosobruchus analis]
MEISDFKDFKGLYEGIGAPYTNKKKNTTGVEFLISKVCHIQVRKNSPGILYYKNSFNEDFSEVNFSRTTRRKASYPPSLQCIRDCPRPISNKKYDHLQKLLTWVPKRFHQYYKDLRYENETRGKRKKKNVSSQYVELKKKYYDHKAKVYEEYTKKKLALMERKVVLEERKIIALGTIAANSSKKKNK